LRSQETGRKGSRNRRSLTGDGEFDFEEEMHRSCGTAAIKDDVLFIADKTHVFAIKASQEAE